MAGADLSGASLRRAILIRVDFSFATVEGADLSDVLRAPPAVVYVDERPLGEVLAAHEAFCESGGRAGAAARLAEIDFRPVGTLKRRKLSGLIAPGSVLFGMNLEGVELQGADLSRCDLRAANLRMADLRGARLIDAQLTRADLRGAILGPLEIGQGRFIRADLSRANLRQADLRRAFALRARLPEADLSDAKLDGCVLTDVELGG